MPVASLQAQLQQLRAQLKLSQSPKQSRMLQSAIARLEEKLKEEAAEQARLKAEAEAKAAQEREVKAKQEVIAKQTQAEDEKAIAKQASSPAKSEKKAHKPLPPRTRQTVRGGKILEAVPGQGQHVFCWKVWAQIQTDVDGNYLLFLKNVDEAIPISHLSKPARQALENVELPVERFCSLYPTVKDGKIELVKLQYCAKQEKHPEQFFVKGYWIAETSTLQIQTDFRYQRERSRNIFHPIPVKDGITAPETGFRSLVLERDRLNLWVVGELPMEEEG